MGMAGPHALLRISFCVLASDIRSLAPRRFPRSKQPYYDALEQADTSWAKGELDLSAMEDILDEALASQLASVIEEAQNSRENQQLPRQPEGIRANDQWSSKPSSPGSSRKSTIEEMGWRKTLSIVLPIVIALSAGAWQLLLNWDHPSVKALREMVLPSGLEQSPPAVAPSSERSP